MYQSYINLMLKVTSKVLLGLKDPSALKFVATQHVYNMLVINIATCWMCVGNVPNIHICLHTILGPWGQGPITGH